MRTKLRGSALLLTVLACGDGLHPQVSDAQTAGPYRSPTRAGLLVVEVHPHPSPIPLNKPFRLNILLFEPDGTTPVESALLEVDGWMEDHGHGMLRRSAVEEIKPGFYEVRGMLFHMAGQWDLRVEASRMLLSEEFRTLERDGVAFGVDL